MPKDSAIKQVVSHQSFMASLLTFSTVSSLTAVAGRPHQCKSSHDNLPHLNSAFHFATVE